MHVPAEPPGHSPGPTGPAPGASRCTSCRPRPRDATLAGCASPACTRCHGRRSVPQLAGCARRHAAVARSRDRPAAAIARQPRSPRSRHLPAAAISQQPKPPPPHSHHLPRERCTPPGRSRAPFCNSPPTRAICKRSCNPAGPARRPRSPAQTGDCPNRVSKRDGVGEDVGVGLHRGMKWDRVGHRMVMHRGTRVAGLLPPSHPGSDFVTDA